MGGTYMRSFPNEANLQAKIAAAGKPIDPRKLAMRTNTPVCNIASSGDVNFFRPIPFINALVGRILRTMHRAFAVAAVNHGKQI